MGHRACLRVSGLLIWDIFTGYALKIRITFIQNQDLDTWKTQSFILKAKLHLLSYFFVKKIPLSRRVGYVIDGWISGSAMYVCHTNQIGSTINSQSISFFSYKG